MIPVTKTFLPPAEAYMSCLKPAWDNCWITNRGELVQQLEKLLKDYLGVSKILITTNGTLPIQIALKSLNLKGEIITTPFSYIATTSSIVWEGLKPIFVDIDPEYLTIDEKHIEAAITPNTSAILATHVYGNPCNVDVIEKLAQKYQLKVIYDAAHCFGVKFKNSSIFNYGHVATCSFHATKLFHTGEGGALFCNEDSLYETLFYQHNFGHNGPEKFHGMGINAKISELQAAMGLAVFPYINHIIESRKQIVETYYQLLKEKNVTLLKIREGTLWNYAYFPVIFETEEKLLEVKNNMNKVNIFPRRYFYPSLNTITYLNNHQKMVVSESIACRVLCLPLYVGLSNNDIEKICSFI